MKRIFSQLLFLSIAGLLLFGGLASAQRPAHLEGEWKGTLAAGPTQLRLVLNVAKDAKGAYSGTLTSVDQDNAVIPIDVIRVESDSVHLELNQVNGTYDGKFNADHSSLTGEWSQGSALPLTFTRSNSKDSK